MIDQLREKDDGELNENHEGHTATKLLQQWHQQPSISHSPTLHSSIKPIHKVFQNAQAPIALSKAATSNKGSNKRALVISSDSCTLRCFITKNTTSSYCNTTTSTPTSFKATASVAQSKRSTATKVAKTSKLDEGLMHRCRELIRIKAHQTLTRDSEPSPDKVTRHTAARKRRLMDAGRMDAGGMNAGGMNAGRMNEKIKDEKVSLDDSDKTLKGASSSNSTASLQEGAHGE